MLAFAFIVLKDILKYILITALVLVYVDYGPGGESVGALVGTFKGVLTAIDWQPLVATVAEQGDNIMTGLLGTKQNTAQIALAATSGDVQ